MKKALFALGAVVLAGALPATRALAQTDPDIRNIRPVVMLLVDTSGSMERMPGGEDAALPMCSGVPSGTNHRNRWTTVLEALTGSWSASDFSCTAVPRNTSAFVGQPDYQYFLPYHRPSLTRPQVNDGVLDVYLDRIKFGLMTFDNTYTFRDPPEYVNQQLYPRTAFLSRLANNITGPGEFSYGEPRPLTFPGCATTFMVDTGARNESASMGRLVSVGLESDDHRVINQSVQSTLLGIRPYGATPISSLLEDFRYYATNHPDMTSSDPYAACRDRYVLLLTDGRPDAEFRDARFNCDAVGGCPYDRATTIASDLCRYNPITGSCAGVVDGVFVVAFDVSDASAIAELDDIAARGGTGAALLASDRTELLRRIGDALDRAAPGTTTRTRPAFIAGGSTFTTGNAVQHEFNAGFRVGDSDTPWTGVLERTRYLCNASLVPEAEPVADRVRFDQVLNSRTAPRRLLTVVTSDAADMTGNLIGPDADSVPLGAVSLSGTVTVPGLVDFSSANVTAAHLGLSGGSASTLSARRDEIVAWVHGTTPDRVDARLGDIYHSSPVAVGPPMLDIADESYNLFRRRPEVANRPTVVYVGTNDGVLHAFVAEDWSNPDTGARLSAGEELWGFVPPILVPKLDSATSSHQIMVDGTPVIRDIYYRRLPTDPPNADIYHTVLVMGFRAGAPGYFALDITDPFNPEFLWQFVGEQATGRGGGATRRVTPLGLSYGRPAIGQVLVDVGGVLQERAVALLPGGAGSVDEETARTTGPVGCPAQGIGQPPVTDGTTTARSRQRCWSNTGRILTWVDIVTGEIIRTFDETVFNAPLTGGVAMYPGDPGTVAERAFLTDADGVIWAVDFSKRRPADWDVRPFHDIFWDAAATEGQPAYDPPVISVDQQGNLVVLIATGDIDRLDGRAANRVVSLTEERTFSSTGVPSFATALNWEIRLRAGEQVTGQLELFQSTVYFASFESGSDPTNLCELGQSRIWAVDYLNEGASPPSGYSDPGAAFPQPRFERTPGTGVFDLHFQGPYTDQLVLGVGVTQRPTCIEGVNESDPYIGARYRVTNVGGGGFELSAQVSGGSTASGGGAVATVTTPLRAPQSFTTVTGFAGRVDY